MSTSITIRQANPADYDQVFSLIREFAEFQNGLDSVTNSPAQMREEGSLFRCFVAETESGNIVGFASYFFAYYSWSGKAIYLDDLYVQQVHRKTGIGTRLLDAVIAHARDTQCLKVRWQVSNWNANAITFYKKMGASIDVVEINCDLKLTDPSQVV